MSGSFFAVTVAAAILIGGAALAAIVLLVAGAQSERRLRIRLEGAGTAADASEFGHARAGVLGDIARQGQSIEKLVDAKGETSHLLIQAGWRDTSSRMGYYVLQALLPLLLLALTVFASIFSRNPYLEFPRMLVTAAFMVIVGLLAPRYLLRKFAKARRERIGREVPLFTNLLVLLFEAGLSTRQAFASIVKEGTGVLPELQKEVDLVLRQLDAGGEVSLVLRDLGEQLDVGDLSTILGVLRQVDRYGGEVREPLLETLKVIEERRGLELRERVNLMSGRMTVIMVLFFFPSILVFTGGPAFLAIARAFSHLGGK